MRKLAREERRRLRRERRAQRRAAGLPDDEGYEPDPDAEEEAEQTLEQGTQVSMEKANKLGDMLKKTLTSSSAADLPAGEGKSLGATLASSVGEAKVPPNVTKPKTTADLLAAARSGYIASFEAAGLKPAGKEIVGTDGKPATPQQLEALAAHIASEPEALARRPDFFKVLPREKFQDLKKDIRRQDIGEEIFKHVAVTDGERDFVWSQSCGGVSGDCNRYVVQTSYRRGEGVPPEDLGSLWTTVHDGAPRAAAAPAPAVNPRSIRSRLNVVLGHIRSAFRGGSPTKSEQSVPGVFAGSFSWGGGHQPEVTFTKSPEKKAVDVASPVLPILPEKRPLAVGALLLAAAGLAAVTLLNRG